MAPSLGQIVAHHRAQAAADRRDPKALEERAQQAPAPRGFARALREGPGLGVVAEVKRRSPSRGPLDPGLDAAALACDYAAGGARALSVLTDAEFFGALPEDLPSARRATSLPVLRKDFTVDPRDVCDARLLGADCVLLIVAALKDEELTSLAALARRLALDVLVEVHDRAELHRALGVVDPGEVLLGVNQRDLTTFAVDHHRAVALAPELPAGAVTVAESGIRGPADAQALAGAGYRGILVGESLLQAPDRRRAVADLIAAAEAGAARGALAP